MGSSLETRYFEFDLWVVFGIFWLWGGWIRFFGYGPHVQRDRPVYFSERYGYRKIIRIGRWSFQWLVP